MNKTELVKMVVNKAGMTREDASMVLNVVLDSVKDGLTADGRVALTGFGSFTLNVRAARNARNPKTGEPIAVPEKTVVKFKPGIGLREMAAGLTVTTVTVADVVEDTTADVEADMEAGMNDTVADVVEDTTADVEADMEAGMNDTVAEVEAVDDLSFIDKMLDGEFDDAVNE